MSNRIEKTWTPQEFLKHLEIDAGTLEWSDYTYGCDDEPGSIEWDSSRRLFVKREIEHDI